MFNLKAGSVRPLPEEIPADILEKMAAIDSGRWTIEDVLELQIDEDEVGEVTTAVAVGSGTDRPLGQIRAIGTYEKLKRSYETYLQMSGRKDTKESLREFMERAAPGNDTLTDQFTKYLKGE